MQTPLDVSNVSSTTVCLSATELARPRAGMTYQGYFHGQLLFFVGLVMASRQMTYRKTHPRITIPLPTRPPRAPRTRVHMTQHSTPGHAACQC